MFPERKRGTFYFPFPQKSLSTELVLFVREDEDNTDYNQRKCSDSFMVLLLKVFKVLIITKFETLIYH